MLSLLASFDSGKPDTVIEREALRVAFNTTKASCAVLATITDEVDGGKAKTPGTLARKVALISKDGLIDTCWGNIRIVNLGFDAKEEVAEAAEWHHRAGDMESSVYGL